MTRHRPAAASGPPASPPASSRPGAQGPRAGRQRRARATTPPRVFTANRCKANPVLWSQQVVKDGVVRAVVLNSGGANCFTGPDGFQTTHRGRRAGRPTQLGIGAGDVVVCSTGLIGLTNPRRPVARRGRRGVRRAVGRRRRRRGRGDHDHRLGQQAGRRRGRRLDDRRDGQGRRACSPRSWPPCSWCSPPTRSSRAADLDAALRAATRVSFDRLDSDGCMSTNDTVTVLASGASGITPSLAGLHRRRSPGLHRPGHAAARGRRGRRPRDRDHRR